MKILILGRTGQLGNELYREATLRKLKIIAPSHKEIDISDKKKLSDLVEKIKPEIVLNATAYHVVADCERNPFEAFRINAIAVGNLAEICSKANILFVTYSTDYVFDGKKGSSYIETDQPFPLQTYGASKLAGEYLALTFGRSIVIRSCGIYGGERGSRSKKGNFALNILKERDKKTLEVSSEQIVSPTYASDLARATFELLAHRGIYGTYHLVNEGHCSWAEFAKKIIKYSGSKTKIIPVDRSGSSGGAKRPLFSALRNTRAKKLGIKLPSLDDSLRAYLNSLKI